MRLCVTVPKLLLDAHLNTDLEFAESQWALEDRSYFQHFENVDCPVILDNSAAFRPAPIEFTQLIGLGRRLQHPILVTPDYAFHGARTLWGAARARLLLHTFPHGSRYRLLGVVQGRTFIEWLTCYAVLRKLVDI